MKNKEWAALTLGAGALAVILTIAAGASFVESLEQEALESGEITDCTLVTFQDYQGFVITIPVSKELSHGAIVAWSIENNLSLIDIQPCSFEDSQAYTQQLKDSQQHSATATVQPSHQLQAPDLSQEPQATSTIDYSQQPSGAMDRDTIREILASKPSDSQFTVTHDVGFGRLETSLVEKTNNSTLRVVDPETGKIGHKIVPIRKIHSIP